MRRAPSSIRLTSLLFAGLLLGLPLLLPAAETVHLRADVWMPYNGDPESQTPGYGVELAKAIFEPRGIKVDYQTMPWADALATARDGKIDGVIGPGSTELDGLTVPQESIGEPCVVLLVRKDNPWKFENVASLKGVRLGMIEGYTYWEALDEYIKNAKAPAVISFSGETPLVNALIQLKSGKIDALPEMMGVFVWTAKGMGIEPSDFRIVYTWKNEPIYLAFSKTPRGIRFAQLFDVGIKQLRASGELAKLLKRYGLAEWK